MVWTCGKKRGNTLAPDGSKRFGHRKKTSRMTQEDMMIMMVMMMMMIMI